MKKLGYVFTMCCLSMVLGCHLVLAQNESVPFNGKVTDLQGNPLKGVRVWTKSPNSYAKSDKQGRFGLTDVQSADTLRLLYRKKLYVLPVEGRKGLHVSLGDQILSQEDNQLSDLGFGFVRKRERTTPSSGISGEELVKTGKMYVLEALVGKVSGLSIFGENVYIRGIGTNTEHTRPLYLVDGMQVESLAYVSVYVVDHVEVLKDASIYGAQGANGAILVTTKSASR